MKNDDFHDRGRRLREERKRLGMDSQDDLAEILGVKKNSIVRYEKHNAPMDTNQLDILKEHGFDVDYILYGIKGELNDYEDLNDEQKRLLMLFNEVPESMRPGLLAIVDTYVQQFKSH